MKNPTNLSDPNRYSQKINWRDVVSWREVAASIITLLLGVALLFYNLSDYPADFGLLLFSLFILSNDMVWYFLFRRTKNTLYLVGVALFAYFFLITIVLFILNYFFD